MRLAAYQDRQVEVKAKNGQVTQMKWIISKMLAWRQVRRLRCLWGIPAQMNSLQFGI